MVRPRQTRYPPDMFHKWSYKLKFLLVWWGGVCLYQTVEIAFVTYSSFRTVYGAAETLGKCSTLFPNSLSDHPAMWIKCLLSKFPSIPIFIHNWCSSVEHEYVMSAYVVSFLDHSAMIVIGLTLPISLSGLDSELLLLVSDD